jgi:hypothetical protein
MKEQLKPYKTVEQIAKKHRMDVSDIQKQLDMGAPIEHEHTKNQKLAVEIALQHLDEFPDYYTRLKKMEASAKKEHKKFKDVVEAKKMKGEDPCWKGYEMIGKKKKGGKEVPNCVPVEEEMGMRYCPKCEKDETRDVCKYGPKYWDMFSLPSKLSPNQMKFSIAQVHPANESKEPDHEYSMARSELSTIISAAKRLRGKLNGEGNIEAWVQSKITKAADYIDAAADYLDSGEHEVKEACWKGYKKVGMKKKGNKIVPNCVAESVSIEDANGNPYVEFIDIMNPEPLKAKKGIGSRILGEGPSFEVGSSKLTSAQEKLHTMSPSQRSQLPSQMVKKLVGVDLPPLKASPSSMVKTADSYEPERKSFTEFMLEASAAWQRKAGKNPEGGLNAKGVASYRAQNPGSKLQTAVTTKPSKLKPGSKDAKRRKSFCARMGGNPGPMKDEKGRPTRKALSLRKWNC